MKTEPTTKEKQKGCIILVAFIITIPFAIWLFSSDEPETVNYTKEQTDSIKIASQFDRWDGSHIKTREAIQSLMNDPESYENVETRYIQYASNDTLMKVVVKFRGKNQFGGVVTQVYTSLIDTAGNVIDLREIN